MTNPITVDTTINAPVEKVWNKFTNPEHITKWNHASDDWHSPSATNDLLEGGRFDFRMEAKDGSAGFNFTGTYTEVIPNQKIAYTMDDGRKAEVNFETAGDSTQVVTQFEPESANPNEFQKAGWQAILDNFKKYTESNA